MSTPDLHLRTLFVFNSEGRITSTREPAATPGPLFALVRGAGGSAWAVRADVPEEVAGELDRLAREEPPVMDLGASPLHEDRYLALLRGGGAPAAPVIRPWSGPAFVFPEALPPVTDVMLVEDERRLERNFRGWVAGEIAAGRAPVMAIVEGGSPVSICFCARRSADAAEAGLETAAAWRGLGFASRVTAAWARAIRATGRIPLYSTSWTNDASLAVARKLGLIAYASNWSLSD